MRTISGDPIKINLELRISSKPLEHNNTPEEKDAENAYKYDPAKSIKSLRTYQLGVVYRDKYGRETPVFSTSTKQDGGDNSKASVYLEKWFADRQTKLK